MKTKVFFSTTLLLVLGIFAIANAKPIFVDDFESGFSDSWIITDGGKWEVKSEGGNHFLQKTGGEWCIASVDNVGGLKEHKELWAVARTRVDVAAANEGAEFGLLINPDIKQGNWYFTIRAQSGQAGFDEMGVAWHALVPYDSWKVEKWHQVKIAIIDEVMYGKAWPDGEDEPKEWLTQTDVTTHLDEDGVGVGTDTNEVSFDDIIVADSEENLTLAVSPKEKLPITWGKIKSLGY